MPVLEALQPQDPRRVGPYRIEARLGAGGMGRVFLGRSRTGRAVAVKVVHPELAADAEFRQRFAREISLARTVSGFFTAGVVDADPGGEPPWLATAYVPGLSLDQAVAEHGPWREEAVLALGAGLAEALESIHSAGVVHRDLKPSNVLLAADGPRVIDFGISVAVEGSRLTRTGTAIGTPGFISPEQLTGASVGPPSDVFCLGAVLAFAATATGPFGSGSWQGVWYRTVHEEPDLAALPPTLRSVVDRCLDKRPEERPTATALLDVLTGGVPDDGTLIELYTEARWLPEPVAHVVRTLVATPAPLPSGGPDDATSAVARSSTAPEPQATVAEPSSPEAPTEIAGGAEPSAPEPTGDTVRTAAPPSSRDAPANPARVVRGGTTRVIAQDVQNRRRGYGRPSSWGRPHEQPPPSKIRERLITSTIVAAPVVLLALAYTIITWTTPASDPSMPPETTSAEELPASPSDVTTLKASPTNPLQAPIDYCDLLKTAQVRQLVPRSSGEPDSERGGCTWVSRGRALDVTPWDAARPPDDPQWWFPNSEAAHEEFLHLKELAADSSDVLWSRPDTGSGKVYRSVETKGRRVPGVGQEAFASDTGPRAGGVQITELTARVDNIIIKVSYTVVDASVSDQGIRDGAVRAARWISTALRRK